ncbi:MAG: hypothetical protein ACRDDY_06345 [Clostridium sp.]
MDYFFVNVNKKKNKIKKKDTKLKITNSVHRGLWITCEKSVDISVDKIKFHGE